MKSHRSKGMAIAAFMERAAKPLTAQEIVAGAHASISVVRIHLAQFVEDGEAHIAGTRERESGAKGGSASTTWLWGPAPEADADEPLPSMAPIYVKGAPPRFVAPCMALYALMGAQA